MGCQQAYIYNVITHNVTFIDDTFGISLDQLKYLLCLQILTILTGTQVATDCNGITNGTSIIDDCGVCQQAYIYNVITHNVTFIDDTNSLSLDPTDLLVMPGILMTLIGTLVALIVMELQTEHLL